LEKDIVIRKMALNLEYKYESFREAFGWQMARRTDAFGTWLHPERNLKASHKVGKYIYTI
jgi:hypothetical protein